MQDVLSGCIVYCAVVDRVGSGLAGEPMRVDVTKLCCCHNHQSVSFIDVEHSGSELCS